MSIIIQPPVSVAHRGGIAYDAGTVRTIADITTTVVTIDTVLYDTENAFDLVNNRLTVPAGVSYMQFFAFIAWSNNAAGYRDLAIWRNGSFNITTAANLTGRVKYESGIITNQNYVSPVIPVTPGDTFDARVFHNCGTNLFINSVGDSRSFLGYKVIE